jgi:hypothetical protein
MTTNANGHAELETRVASLRAELTQLPESARSAVLEQTLVDIQVIPPICGLILNPTQFESDLRTIVHRVTVTATLVSPAAINVGDSFQVNTTLRNCSGFRLEKATLVANGTTFATIIGPSTVDVGPVANGASALAAFTCKAVAQTPTLGGPADPLVNVFARCVLDLTSATGSATVSGEVFPI